MNPAVPPSSGQIALLSVAILLFIAGGFISIRRLRKESNRLRIAAKACLYWGLLTAFAVLIWHSQTRGSWLPLEDNFDALIWLGLLLVGFVLYVQRRRPLGGLDWFIMPIVVFLLVAAAVFGRGRPQAYANGRNVWTWVHLAGVYGQAVAFAIAGATGVMYLLARRRLRAKPAAPGPDLGSLERLERLTFSAVTLGFALLTVGLVTGVFLLRERHRLGTSLQSPVIVLSLVLWLLYAVVLHAPLNPSLRGRRVAMMSVVGLALLIGTLVMVQFMGGSH